MSTQIQETHQNSKQLKKKEKHFPPAVERWSIVDNVFLLFIFIGSYVFEYLIIDLYSYIRYVCIVFCSHIQKNIIQILEFIFV